MSVFRLSDLSCQQKVYDRLVAAGLQRETCVQKAAHFDRAADRLLARGIAPTSPAYARFVPGRIEVLGKHTDYAGGRSLTAAVDRGFSAIAVARQDGQLLVTDANSDETVGFSISRDLKPTSGHWSNYPMTVARRIAQNFLGPFRGAEISLVSDLPPASGMSSSSAMVIAIFQLLDDIHHLASQETYQRNIHNRLDLAGYVAAIENGQNFAGLAGGKGVGTFGGSEDHTAILNSSVGQLTQYAYCPVRVERSIAIDPDYLFGIASCGVLAEKTGAALEKYNRSTKLATVATETWREVTGRNDPHLAAAIESAPHAADRFREAILCSRHADYSAQELADRFEHFWAESEQIIPAVPGVLDRTTCEYFGQLVDRSQTQGAKLLGNQVPETIALANMARDLGAVAASAFGAGFGGSVWAFVNRDELPSLLKSWQSRYQKSFPDTARRATFFAAEAGPAAFAL